MTTQTVDPDADSHRDGQVAPGDGDPARQAGVDEPPGPLAAPWHGLGGRDRSARGQGTLPSTLGHGVLARRGDDIGRLPGSPDPGAEYPVRPALVDEHEGGEDQGHDGHDLECVGRRGRVADGEVVGLGDAGDHDPRVEVQEDRGGQPDDADRGGDEGPTLELLPQQPSDDGDGGDGQHRDERRHESGVVDVVGVLVGPSQEGQQGSGRGGREDLGRLRGAGVDVVGGLE